MDPATTVSDTSQYLSLRNTRVTLTEKRGRKTKTTVGILRFVRPSDGAVILSDAQGLESAFLPNVITSVTDARRECANCHTRANNVFGDPEFCADCERTRAAREQQSGQIYETCQGCGAPNAIYSPLAGDFYCGQCHAKNGTLAGNTVEARTLENITSCKGSDETSAKHQWVPVKGGRWRCSGCHVDRYTRA